MKRSGLLLTAALSLAMSLTATFSPSHSATADDPLPNVDELIRQLGDKDFEVREAAARKLMAREDAIPALRKAAKSDDVEIARRANEILTALAQASEKRDLKKLHSYAAAGEVDRALELLVRRKAWDDEQTAWQAMTEFAEKAMELGQTAFGKPLVPKRNEYLPVGDFAQFMKNVNPEFSVSNKIKPDPRKQRDGSFVVRAESITVEETSTYDLLASAGVVRADDLGYCVVFAGDSIHVPKLAFCVVVCDGDVRASDSLRNCLVIARGDVHCEGAWVTDSRIITSGRFQFKREKDVHRTQIKEHDKIPLDFVKFFDPAQVGITVEAADEGVRVKTADVEKSFGSAGLRIGDRVLALDDKKVDSVESFRRVLRAKLAQGEKIVLKIRRDDRTLEIPITCKD
jgi:hypothetical protein